MQHFKSLNLYIHDQRNAEHSPERGFPGLFIHSAAAPGNQTILVHS